MDGIQTGLDFIGLIPGVGEIADGLSAPLFSTTNRAAAEYGAAYYSSKEGQKQLDGNMDDYIFDGGITLPTMEIIKNSDGSFSKPSYDLWAFANEPESSGEFVGSDTWNSASNWMTGIGLAEGAASYRLGRVLDKRLAYSFTSFPYESGKVKVPATSFKTPLGRVNVNTSFVKGAATSLKVVGATLGVVGAGMTIAEIYTGQKNLVGEGGLDLIMGGVGFIPGGGWIVSGVYFGGKWALEATGNDFWNK